MKNYYEILGLKITALGEDIKTAYKKLAKRWHPDVNKTDPSAEEKFKEINEAHEHLSDPEKRRAYDLKFQAFFNSNKNHTHSKQSREFDWGPGFIILAVILVGILLVPAFSPSKEKQFARPQ